MKLKTKELTTCALFAALIAIGAVSYTHLLDRKIGAHTLAELKTWVEALL